MKKQLVISRYKENVDWINDVRCFDNITLYNKGEPFIGNHNFDYYELPNVGREAHTIIHHIINNYDNLYDITVFCQGNPFEHTNRIKTGEDFNTKLTDYRFGNIAEPLDKNLQVDYSGYTYTTFKTCLDGLPPTIMFSSGGQWMVPKHCIRSKSLNFYKKIYEELKIDRKFNNDGIFNAWTLEGLWISIYNENIKEKISFSEQL